MVAYYDPDRPPEISVFGISPGAWMFFSILISSLFIISLFAPKEPCYDHVLMNEGMWCESTHNLRVEQGLPVCRCKDGN